MDRQNYPKLIDFGSCTHIFGQEDVFKPVDTFRIYFVYLVRSTPGYFAEYSCYKDVIQVKDRMSSSQFYKHPLFDVYSFGQILDEVLNF